MPYSWLSKYSWEFSFWISTLSKRALAEVWRGAIKGHLNERIRDHVQNDRNWRRLGSGWRRKQDVPSKANKQQNLDFKIEEMKVVVDNKLKNNKNFVSWTNEKTRKKLLTAKRATRHRDDNNNAKKFEKGNPGKQILCKKYLHNHATASKYSLDPHSHLKSCVIYNKNSPSILKW